MDPGLTNWFASVLVVGLRVAGVLSFAPFLGSLSIPARIKAGGAVALTALLVPVVGPQPLPPSSAQVVLLVVHETMVGALLGLTVQFVFEGAQFAGQLAGLQMGLSLETLIDPQTLADTPVMAILFQTVALLIFLAYDVHYWILQALVDSFRLLPPAPALFPRPAALHLLALSNAFWVLGVEMAGPVIVATLGADLALSFLTRLSPPFSALFVGLAAKNLLGYAVLLLVAGLWPTLLHRFFLQALRDALHLFGKAF